MADPKKLRELASWYREFAERASNPMIWDCRMRTAEDLDIEARRVEKIQAATLRLRRRLPKSVRAS